MRRLSKAAIPGIRFSAKRVRTLTILLTAGVALLQGFVWAFQTGEVLRDPVALLQLRLDRGNLELKFDPKHGYLSSVLSQLEIPVSSQTLVFSKTSLHSDLISPSTPRALYFNDDVYVGWVQNAPMLEIASVDPQFGTFFYVLDQKEATSPVFRRLSAPCTSCHGPARDDVPSPLLLMMSVGALPTGEAVGDFQIVTDRTPLAERWGGWYVSATPGSDMHRGNKVIAGGAERLLGAPTSVSGPFDASRYLTTSSDIVALMLLGHQTDVHNRISEAAFQVRAMPADVPQARIAEAVEPLVRSLLFSGEAPFSSAVQGSSAFAQEFTAKGRSDKRGRSLKNLDLSRRLLRYPLSYLIYSDSFDHMPAGAREYVFRRLWEVLTGKDLSEDFRHLSATDRSALLEILSETKPEFEMWVRKTAGAGR